MVLPGLRAVWALRLDEIALPLTCTLLLASYVMPGTWVVVLALMATASCVVQDQGCKPADMALSHLGLQPTFTRLQGAGPRCETNTHAAR